MVFEVDFVVGEVSVSLGFESAVPCAPPLLEAHIFVQHLQSTQQSAYLYGYKLISLLVK